MIAIFMLALPPLVPAWTPPATMTVLTLEVLCLAVIVALWSRRLMEPALRTAAGIVFAIFLLAAIDQLRAAITNATPIVGGRTPIVGLFVIGVPCAVFALRGFRSNDEDAIDESDLNGEDLDEFDGEESAEESDLKDDPARDPSRPR
ncbi:MAG: hypothetical protein RBS39_00735 [Phycisphaerales bacterium]|nr:hypothetical protein [Phycisphaerales bacterium]